MINFINYIHNDSYTILKFMGEYLYEYLYNEKIVNNYILTSNNYIKNKNDFIYKYYNNSIVNNKIYCYKFFKKFMYDSLIVNNINFNIVNEYIKKYNNLFISYGSDNDTGNSKYNRIVNNYNKNIFYLEWIKNKLPIKITKYLNIKKSPTIQIILSDKDFFIINNLYQNTNKDGTYIGTYYEYNKNINKKLNSIIENMVDIFFKLKIKGYVNLDFIIDEEDNIFLSEINYRKTYSLIVVQILSKYIYDYPISVIEYLSFKEQIHNFNKDNFIPFKTEFIYDENIIGNNINYLRYDIENILKNKKKNNILYYSLKRNNKNTILKITI